MVREAEEFAAEDEMQRKRIETLNSFTALIYNIKSQVTGDGPLVDKISDDDKATVLKAVKDAQDFVDREGQYASVEELEEKLAELQSSFNPITEKLYKAGAEDDDQEPFMSHDEL